jgi:hypothetical protein
LMWCGRKMKQNYQSASQSFTDLARSELEAQRANKEDRRQKLSNLIEQFTVDRFSPIWQQQRTDLVQQQEQVAIADLLKNAQLTPNAPEQTRLLKEEREREMWQRALLDELTASHNILNVATITRARAALQGSAQEIRTACQRLSQERQHALQTITDTQLLRANQEHQARHILEQVQKELGVMHHMLVQSYGEIDQRFADQVRGIEHLLQEGRERTNSVQSTYDPDRALLDAQHARRDLQRFKEQVTTIVTEQLDHREQQRMEARGNLDALEHMVKEAQEGKVMMTRSGQELHQRIEELRMALDQVDISRANNELQRQVERIEPLTQRIFREVGEGQQKVTVQVIAETLTELGYYDDLEQQNAPRISMSGPGMKVSAKRAADEAVEEEGAKNERVVTFTVDRDGMISYDFSGYKGKECLKASHEVFTALKKKGITILDYADAKRVEDAPAGSLTPQMLVNSPLAPHIVVNKQQAILSEKIMDILYTKMHFSRVFQSASDGSIIIEALQGNIGYHITLMSDGETSLLRNGDDLHLDDTSDLFVLQLHEAMQEVVVEPEPAPQIEPPQAKKKSEETGYYELRQSQELDQQ